MDTLAEILVNKTELKTIRDNIDKILSKPSVGINLQYVSYEREELTERQKQILKYVEKKPGTTKEDVIKNNPRIGSRMTIVHAIEALIEMRMLIVKRDLNQHIQPLYTNNEHVVLSLFYDLQLFKQVYFRLIDETTKRLTNTNKKLPKNSDVDRHYRGSLTPQLFEALLSPYKYMIIMCITSDLLLWQERPLNNDTLHNKLAVLYDSLKEIHTRLHESITPLLTSEFYSDLQEEPLKSSLSHIQSGLRPEQFLSIFKDFRLVAFAEPVLDVIWKISYPVLSHPLYEPVEKSRKDALKDWRNVISGYKPKTTQEQNLGEKID